MKKIIISIGAAIMFLSSTITSAEVNLYVRDIRSGQGFTQQEMWPPIEKDKKIYIGCRKCGSFRGALLTSIMQSGGKLIPDKDEAEFVVHVIMDVVLPNEGGSKRAATEYAWGQKSLTLAPVIVNNPADYQLPSPQSGRTAMGEVSQRAFDMGSDIGVLHGLNQVTGGSGGSLFGAITSGVGLIFGLADTFTNKGAETEASQLPAGIMIGEITISHLAGAREVAFIRLVAASDTDETPDSLVRNTFMKITEALYGSGFAVSPTCPAGYVLSKTEADTCVLDPGAKEVKETRILAPADAATVAE